MSPITTAYMGQIQCAAINAALIGDNTIIAAPGAGKRNHIFEMIYQNTSDTVLTVIEKSGTTALNGLGIKLKKDTDGCGGMRGFTGIPGVSVMRLGANEAFILNLSAAKQVSGCLWYYVATE